MDDGREMLKISMTRMWNVNMDSIGKHDMSNMSEKWMKESRYIVFLTIYISSQNFHHDEIIVLHSSNTKYKEQKLYTHRKSCFFLLHSRLFPSVIERIFSAVMIRMKKRDWHDFDTHHILFIDSGDLLPRWIRVSSLHKFVCSFSWIFKQIP